MCFLRNLPSLKIEEVGQGVIISWIMLHLPPVQTVVVKRPFTISTNHAPTVSLPLLTTCPSMWSLTEVVQTCNNHN